MTLEVMEVVDILRSERVAFESIVVDVADKPLKI
jgi:hypothetical protein